MVKDLHKKRKKGITALPKRGHKAKSIEISTYKQAFLELKILFYLKEHNIVAPSHLATEVLRIRLKVSNQICNDLKEKKLINRESTTRKSFVYAKTETGNKACKTILNWFEQNEWNGLEWFKLVLRLRDQTYKDVE